MNKVNSLNYCTGDEADNIVKNLNLSEKTVNNYDVVKDRFRSFFCC